MTVASSRFTGSHISQPRCENSTCSAGGIRIGNSTRGVSSNDPNVARIAIDLGFDAFNVPCAIRNGADESVFNRQGKIPWDGRSPLKIVTHHWSDNRMKGADCYELLDRWLADVWLRERFAFAAEKSGLPLLPLTAFEPQAAAYGLIPLDYLVVKGVIPFELMSRDLLVGTLNPLNEKLRAELDTLTGRRCHFYLVHPSDFDATLDKIRKQLQGPEPAKKT